MTLRNDQPTAAPAESSTPKPRWENLDAENGARLLRAVLRDLDTIADRLERVANAYTDLDHNERVRLGKTAPDLVSALIMAEQYHAGRRVPGGGS